MVVKAKICGLTRPGDAAFAAGHGAWRLGVIFAGGPRLITVSQAREIVSAAAGVPVLGVFGQQSLETMLETMENAGLAGAQLHGNYPGPVAAALRVRGFEVWRVVAVAATAGVARELAAAAAAADALLVEARSPGGSGGKGITIPLDVARSARLAAPRIPFVLAGGLTADSVAAAIRAVGPDAVDVSSGVEISAGVKDHARMARFLENVFAARSAA
jgi:phosphoribosylanthranilate isomerase